MRHYLNRAARWRGTVLSSWLIGAALTPSAGVGQAYGQAAHLDSTLTSTRTFQVLQLSTNVALLPNGLYRWSFTLTNPIGNSSRVRFFTAAPSCDLTRNLEYSIAARMGRDGVSGPERGSGRAEDQLVRRLQSAGTVFPRHAVAQSGARPKREGVQF